MIRSGQPHSLSLRIKSDPCVLGVVRAAVERFAELVGFDERRRGQVILAVDEGCTNIIRHCYRGRLDGDIDVELWSEPAENGLVRLCIRLRDYGPRIDGACVLPSPVKDPERPGGLGLQLIHDVMDSVELEAAVDPGNALLMTATCAPPRAGEAEA